MKFAILDVMDKGAYLRQRLLDAGHTAATEVAEADLVLLDCDWAWAHPRPELIGQAVSGGAKVVLYPHGGQATVHVYDGLTEPHPGVSLRLEHGKGSLEISELLGLELKQEAHGWLYSPTQPFQPVMEPQRILFAPLHPNMEALQKGRAGNGHDPAPGVNRHVYRQLLDMNVPLFVSVVGPLWRNGIWPHPRARMMFNQEMRFAHAYQLIQECDVVVGAGTLAAAGVACGKPTVFIDRHDCADYVDGYYQQARNASLYQDWLEYPYTSSSYDLADLIGEACTGSAGADWWRNRWIGEDGTEEAIRSLVHLVGVQQDDSGASRHVVISGVTAKAKGT